MQILRAALYIRVSTAEQAIYGKSLQAQREYLENYAHDHEMKVVGLYADEGQTARKEFKKRKAIHALLDAVKRDEIDVILFWKMDRWFRSVADFYKVQDILDAHSVKWVAVSEPNINLDTRDGRLNLNIMLSIGQNEVDTTSERIRFTVDSMIRNGRAIGGSNNFPLGYCVREVDGKKRVVKDPDTEHMVLAFYDYFRKHRAKRKTVLYMQETFGIDFSYSMLRTMLTSEFYIGKYRGNTNYCPSYLTLDEWEEIQMISKRNIRQAHSGRVYLFSSLMRCPLCGQKLAGTGCSSIINRKTKEKRTYCYYRCNRAIIDGICTYRHRVSQNLVETHLLENLAQEYDKFRIRKINVSERQQLPSPKKRSSEQIKKEMERLNLLFQKDRIDFDYYDSEYEKLKKELESLSDLPIQTQSRNYDYLESILNTDFKNMYNKLTEENKRSFWHQIIGEIHISEESQITSIDFL